jgi:hypothetical protein
MDKWIDKHPNIYSASVLLSSIAMVCSLLWLISWSAPKLQEFEEKKRRSMPPPQKFMCGIVSLHTATTPRGGFFLGCGSIEGVEHYYYMRDLGSGCYKRETLPVEKVILVESDKVKPNVSYYIEDGWYKSGYKITVPVGTITQIYEVH